MKTKTVSPHEASCDALFNLGFECVGNFAAEDGDDFEARVHLFSLRQNSFSSVQAQVEPDGSVNGMELSAYLKSHCLV